MELFSKHCGHQCVCTTYIWTKYWKDNLPCSGKTGGEIGTKYWKDNLPCSGKTGGEDCKHDTRIEERRITKLVQAHMDVCNKKFQDENPCPKCGSHNVDIDWGTPMWCNDCGHRW